MYCKLFTSLYQGTLRGRSDEILVFTNLLAHCDREGYVDKHWRAIAEEVGLPEDRVKAALIILESVDAESRSSEQDGRRIVRVDDHRAWGWHVTNYAKYRAIRSEEDRRETNRQAQARYREKHKETKVVILSKPSVSACNTSKPMQMQYAEADAKTDTPPTLAQVVAYAKSPHGGIAEVVATAFWRNFQGVGWIDAAQRKITDWKQALHKWAANQGSHGQRTKSDSGKSHQQQAKSSVIPGDESIRPRILN